MISTLAAARRGIVLLLALLHFSGRTTAGSTDPANSADRAVDLSKIKGGILVKDGKQTSCGLGLIDNMASFVSADCLDYKDGKVDQDTVYEVYIDTGYDATASRATVQNITVHPKYNPSTMANNVALIEFNLGSSVSWYNYNAIGRKSWTEIVYAQRYIADVNNMAWAAPQISSQASSDAKCSSLSSLFDSNQNGASCNGVLTTSPSPDMSKCNVPYQIAYAIIGKSLFPAGIYSYSVVEGGGDLCSNSSKIRNYYTLVDDYLVFANVALNRTVHYYRTENTTVPQPDPNYAMAEPSAAQPSGAALVAGNYYSRQTGTNFASQVPTPIAQPTSSSMTPQASSSSKTEQISSSSSPDRGSPDEGSVEGLSKNEVIIVAVSCSVGSLLIALILFFVIKQWKASLRRRHDPFKEASAQLILAEGLGGAYVPGHERPSAEVIEDPIDNQPPPAYPMDERPPEMAHLRNRDTHDAFDSDFNYNNHIHISRNEKN
ncbi:hypothetical protein GGH94_002911 [Coemansia aciculifera]|uniref:Peptidase S1 domain-containing protein n=2 Tax=Coemansia TaxID=4863 RepID=A0A9W8II32_9FUNG|nr:hypothetical protein GGH94_002911 [Coemansia aciculifera]